MLDDVLRVIAAWKVRATIRVIDVADTLDLALATSGLNQVTIAHRPRLLSNNGASSMTGGLAEWLDGKGIRTKTVVSRAHAVGTDAVHRSEEPS